MPDQIVELQAQLDTANLQIKELEARNKESERRVKAAAATRKQVTEGRDRMFLRYAKQHLLLKHVCNDLARAENADVRAITVCELNNWLHENENPDPAETKLDEEIAESLKQAEPLLNILLQMVEMIDHDASVRGHVPQRWESIYEKAKGILRGSPEHTVQKSAQGKASIKDQLLNQGHDDPRCSEEFTAARAAMDPPEFIIKGATSTPLHRCDDE